MTSPFFESLLASIDKSTHKIEELRERGVLATNNELALLSQNPGIAELWKIIAILIQGVDSDEFEQLSLEDVQDFLEISTGLGPTDVEARSELGSFLYAVSDQTADALVIFREARALCLKQLAECTAGMADCLIEMGQKEEARTILEQTLPLCPDSEELLDSLNEAMGTENEREGD